MLSSDQVMEIGAWCDLIAKLLREQGALGPVRAKLSEAAYYESVRAAQSVPVAERKGWLSSLDGDDHRSDVETAMETMRQKPRPAGEGDGIDTPEQFFRVIEVKQPRIKNVRSQMISNVSILATERYGFPVAPSQVGKAWKRYRAELEKWRPELEEWQSPAG